MTLALLLLAGAVQCHVNQDAAGAVLPDAACTPGATLRATAAEVCKSGYSKRVRNVPSSEKRAVMVAYGIDPKRHSAQEIDHLISLELGGSNDQTNLWPEPQEPRPGFREKDKAENALHAAVCSGAVTLEDAQRLIAADWLAVYQKFVEVKK